MKKIFLIFSLCFSLFSLTGCVKGTKACTPKTAQSEQAAILAYAAANGISATAHPSGLYYQVMNPGNGAIPFPTSRVFVTYTGKLTSSGAVFDSQTNSALTGWILNTLIPGWQIGLPLLQKGGTIRLIVPSELAYGCQGAGPIPANAVLYFEITLVDVL